MNKLSQYIYADLEKNYVKWNAWKDPDSFKYDNTNVKDIELVKKINIEEIELIRYSQNASFGFEQQFRNIALSNIVIPDKFVVALIIDSEIKPKSKLRSYKGILSKELKVVSQFIEEEVAIEDNTLIGGFVIVDNTNVEIIIDKYFGDSSTCCFLQFNNNELFNNYFLKTLLENCVIHKNTTLINYFLLCKFLHQNAKIIRIGGDGYDNISVQIISPSSLNFG